VRDACRQSRQVLVQDADEGLVCIALVQEHGLADRRGELELQPEDPLLVLVRGEVAEEIESAFPGGAHLGRAHQFREYGQVCVRELLRVMRMDPRRRPEPPRVGPDQGDGGPRAVQTAAGDDHVPYARGHARFDHFLAVAVKAVVGEVEADVDEGRGH